MPDSLYPQTQSMQLSAGDAPVDIYKDNLEIQMEIPENQTVPLDINLTIQACSNEHCLARESTGFKVW